MPIAMFTANAMDGRRAHAIEAGASHHICKPITPERPLADVEAALGAAQAVDPPEVRSQPPPRFVGIR